MVKAKNDRSMARSDTNSRKTIGPSTSSFRIMREGSRSNHGHIARTLGMEILSGKLKPSKTLPSEPELLARFEVSRTVLREVTKTLAAKGLVVAKTRVGTTVLPSEHWNFFDKDVLSWRLDLGYDATLRDDIAEMRLAFEPKAAALAAKCRTREQLAELRKWIGRMRQPGHSRQSYAEADLGFHLAVGTASGNVLMRGVSAVIETALVASFRLNSPVDEPDVMIDSVASHEAIVDAIEARDAKKAAAAMEKVISMGVARITAGQKSRSKKSSRTKK